MSMFVWQRVPDFWANVIKTSTAICEWVPTNSWRHLKIERPGMNLWSRALIHTHLTRERLVIETLKKDDLLVRFHSVQFSSTSSIVLKKRKSQWKASLKRRVLALLETTATDGRGSKVSGSEHIAAFGFVNCYLFLSPPLSVHLSVPVILCDCSLCLCISVFSVCLCIRRQNWLQSSQKLTKWQVKKPLLMITSEHWR